MRIYMQTSADEDKAPRYYQLVLQADMLEGWTVIREWGVQGGGRRVRRDHFLELEEAQSAMLAIRDAQVKRGYRVVFVQGQERPA